MPRLAVRVPCDRTVGDVLAAVVELAPGLPDDVFGLLTGSGNTIRWRRILDIDSAVTAHARAVVAGSQAATATTPSERIESTHDDDAARTTAAVDRRNRSWRLAGLHRHRVIDAPFDVSAARDADGWTVTGTDWHGVVKRRRHGVLIESLATGGRASGHGTLELQRHGTDRIDIRANDIELSDRLGLRSVRGTIRFETDEARIRLRGRLRVRGVGRLAVLAWPFVGWWAGRKISQQMPFDLVTLTGHDQWPDVVAVADAVLGSKRTEPVRPTARPATLRTPDRTAEPAPPRRLSTPVRSRPSRRLLLGLAPVPLVVGATTALAFIRSDRSTAQSDLPAAIAFSTACEANDVVADVDLAWDDPGCLRMQEEAFHRHSEGPDGNTVITFGWHVDTETVQVGDTVWMPWGAGPATNLCFTSDALDGSLDRGDVVDCFGPGLVTVSCPADPTSTASVFEEQCKGHAGLTAYGATRHTLLEDDRGQRAERLPVTAAVVAGLGTGLVVSGVFLVRGLRTRGPA